ncbi:MAG: DUF116 domain-containing protein [Anaerolineae bacterium]
MTEATYAEAVTGQEEYAALSATPPEQRLLLLPHCLRPTQDCPGKMTPDGLNCGGCPRADCKVARLAAAARAAGYGSICVAPGGRLALRRVKAAQPQAIVAVACDKELEEGVAGVASLDWPGEIPIIVQLPLTRDGCVDTDLDVDGAIVVIQS